MQSEPVHISSDPGIGVSVTLERNENIMEMPLIIRLSSSTRLQIVLQEQMHEVGEVDVASLAAIDVSRFDGLVV